MNASIRMLAAVGKLAEVSSAETIIDLDLTLIDCRPQVRKRFNPVALQELADSIRDRGQIEPCIVRPTANGRYEMVAGERRWRATGLAALETCKVVVREISDKEILLAQAAENLQRENLDALEMADLIHNLIARANGDMDAVATMLGKSPAFVRQFVDLKKAPEEVRELVEKGIAKVDAAVELGKIAKINPDKAKEIAANATAKGKLLREETRGQLAEAKGRKPAAREGQGAKIVIHPKAHADEPVMLGLDKVNVQVTIDPKAAGAKVFLEAEEAHGLAYLLHGAMHKQPAMAWVRFGTRVKAGFPCKDLRIAAVTDED